MHLRPRALVAMAALVLAACGSSDAAAPPAPDTVGGIGGLPGTLVASASTMPAPGDDGDDGDDGVVRTFADEPDSPRSRDEPEPDVDEDLPIGRFVDGNRVLVIGDSILASISDRYGNQLCDRLVPRGWAVQVDAEVSRFIEFGQRVLDRHDGEQWDAAVVMLGNNYDGDPQAFADELDELLDDLEPLPVVLINVTRFEPQQDEVNYILAMAAGEREGVRLLDWAARTADDTPGADRLLAGDGLHLSTSGQVALSAMISGELGRAPSGSFGDCLRSPFRDDSGGTLPDPES
jgi:lysophospholipase L1-like esterase